MGFAARLHAGIHHHHTSGAQSAGTAVIAKALFFAHIAEQAAGGGAAKHAHCHPHHGNAGQVLRRAAGKQHTQLGLGQAGDFLAEVLGFNNGHGQRHGKALGAAGSASQLLQQQLFHQGGIRPLHHHINGCQRKDAVILGFQSLGRYVGQVTFVAAQLNACRGIAVKFAAGLAHTVQALIVELGIQAAGQGFFFNAHSLRVKHTINQVRLKDGTKGDIGIFTGQILTVKGKAILDAADVHRQHAVNSGAALVHAKVGTVQPRQFAGKLRHIRAARIAAFQHQRQHSSIRCAAAQCRVAQMDGNAAAVKFFGIQCGDKYTGSQFFTFQISILRISSEFLG